MNRDLWLTALREANDVPPPDPNADAITSAEFAELTGVNPSTARHQLNRLVRLGKAEPCKKWVKRGGGGFYPAPAYKLIQESANGADRHHRSGTLRRHGKEHRGRSRG